MSSAPKLYFSGTHRHALVWHQVFCVIVWHVCIIIVDSGLPHGLKIYFEIWNEKGWYSPAIALLLLYYINYLSIFDIIIYYIMT